MPCQVLAAPVPDLRKGLGITVVEDWPVKSESIHMTGSLMERDDICRSLIGELAWRVLERTTNTGLLKFVIGYELTKAWDILLRTRNDLTTDDDIDFLNRTLQQFEPWLRSFGVLDVFIGLVFYSLGWILSQEKTLSECGHCGAFFRYRKGKKYCSLLSEGRDCGKKARAKRDYQKHRDKRLEYYKREMKLTRELERKYR